MVWASVLEKAFFECWVLLGIGLSIYSRVFDKIAVRNLSPKFFQANILTTAFRRAISAVNTL